MVERDFSSDDGDCERPLYTGPATRRSGCGPARRVDDDAGTVWGTTRAGGPRWRRHGRPTIDDRQDRDRPVCGLRRRRQRRARSIRGSGSRSPTGLRRIKADPHGREDNGEANDVYTGTVQGVRYLRLRAIPRSRRRRRSVVRGRRPSFTWGRSPGSLLGPSCRPPAPPTSVGAGAPSPRHRRRRTTAGARSTSSTARRPLRHDRAAGSGAGNASRSVSASLTGLTPATTYHYRARGRGRARPLSEAATDLQRTAAVTPPPTPSRPPPRRRRRQHDTRGDAHDAARHEAQGGPRGHGQGPRPLRHRKFAPAGSARLRILGRRSKPIAEGLRPSVPGRTATKGSG